ncbi:MAG: hypothetical protein WBA76_01250 [Phormidesmis sp.]
MVFTERQSRAKGVVEESRLMELHLYPGNQCNRECDFCTVFGAPKGEFTAYTAAHLDAALQSVMVHEQGAIKFFGGEPTLNHQNVMWAIAYLRSHEFKGAIVIYSNGIQADKLLEILAADPLSKTTASLNYSIATGDGAPPMPMSSLRKLEQHEEENRGAIAIGHPAIVDSGRGIDPFTGEEIRPQVAHQCPRCYPVLKTDGQFHACPFAVENTSPHFQIGSVHDSPQTVTQNFETFLSWIDTVHEPYAVEHNLPACTVCWKHLQALPVPDFAPTAEAQAVG